jgi:hypothetical protein
VRSLDRSSHQPSDKPPKRNMSDFGKLEKTKVFDRDTNRWRQVGKFTEGSRPGKDAKK